MHTGTTGLAVLDSQRGALFPWAAVLYAAGIAIYFSLPDEPGPAFWWGAGGVSVAAGVIATFFGPVWRPLALALLLPALGCVAAGARAHAVADVALGFRYYGPIEGRVIGIDRSQSDALRLTLDQVVLARTAPDRTPGRVRISLYGQSGLPRPAAGSTIVLTGHLAPPGGPVEPGGYDFRRHAWFLGLGAVGYTRTPVLELIPPDPRARPVLRLRMAIADAVRAELPGRAGAFAAAITTGDRSALDQPTLEALRATNLAHLLAISGLHMGLLTGFVFAALRIAMTPIPALVLWRNAKKVAAMGALVAGAGYLALSGSNVATERAFIMVAVMLTAVLLDRRAITLRSVALAGLIVLTLRPETLLGPGFQMSFAATTALVTVYGWMQGGDWSKSRAPKPLRFLGGVALSSAVAGLATAPIAAAHFNQIPHFGLLANIVSVPLMGLVVMPAAVLSGLLAPFGLSWLGLRIMEPAILWILTVATEIAAWPGALSTVPAPGPAVLPLTGLAMALAACVRGRGRWAALPVATLALALWTGTDRPPVLIAESGGQVGVLGDAGRMIARPRGDGFAVSTWLENDGDRASQAEAASRPGWTADGPLHVVALGSNRIILGTGKTGAAAALGRCGDGIVVTNQTVVVPPGCLIFDAARLRRTGALGLYPGPDGLVIRAAKQGRRLWSD